MSVVQRCSLTELPVDGCAHCRGVEPEPPAATGSRRAGRTAVPGVPAWQPAPEAAQPRPLPPVRAGYGGGACSGCGAAIKKGDMIQLFTGGGKVLGPCCTPADQPAGSV
jgi:hypothetical protein